MSAPWAAEVEPESSGRPLSPLLLPPKHRTKGREFLLADMAVLGSGRRFSLSSALLRGVANLEPAVPQHTGTQDLSL